MKAYRKKPDIGKTPLRTSPPKRDDLWGCVWVPLFIGISYFVLSAIFRATSNLGSKLDQIICYGALICFVIIMLLGAREAYQEKESKAKEVEKKKWVKNCKTALLTIINRNEASIWWDDSAYRPIRSPNMLELEINSDQKGIFLNQTTIQAEVSQYVYDRLKDCNAVRIYYMPESPMTFFLEEEL